ncbi:hypothetical protein [Halomarina rubra]|uniref:Uncharacterized protein n=1 Tax=Halomarina rubra TaxID=2071873 RepID=A0ABD6AZV5_9EURY|nr:hypothetical protein [Halomarina rubra]
MALQIVGTWSGERRFLLVDESDVNGDPLPGDIEARILDTDTGVRHPPQLLGSIVAHAPYVQPNNGADGELEELLANVDVSNRPR